MNKDLVPIIKRIENLEKDLSQAIGRIEKLEKPVSAGGGPKKAKQKKVAAPTADLDFSLNERAFVKRYAAGKSGPKKFTILLAYLVRGKVDTDVQLSEIKKCWNKMKSLIGDFNRSYTDRAKIQGWVDSKEYGSYNLTSEWKKAL